MIVSDEILNTPPQCRLLAHDAMLPSERTSRQIIHRWICISSILLYSQEENRYNLYSTYFSLLLMLSLVCNSLSQTYKANLSRIYVDIRILSYHNDQSLNQKSVWAPLAFSSQILLKEFSNPFNFLQVISSNYEIINIDKYDYNLAIIVPHK